MAADTRQIQPIIHTQLIRLQLLYRIMILDSPDINVGSYKSVPDLSIFLLIQRTESVMESNF